MSTKRASAAALAHCITCRCDRDSYRMTALEICTPRGGQIAESARVDFDLGILSREGVFRECLRAVATGC